MKQGKHHEGNEPIPSHVAKPRPDGIFGKDNYNNVRIHRALVKDAPISRPIERLGVITSRPILGDLHHQYSGI